MLETYRRKYRKMSLSHPKIEVSCIVIHEKEENTLNRVIYSNSIINTPIIVKMGVKSMKSSIDGKERRYLYQNDVNQLVD